MMNGGWILELINMSVVGGTVIGFVCILRLFLKRLPKKYLCVLWLIPFLRLLLPFTLQSPISILPVNARSVVEAAADGGNIPVLNTGIHVVDKTVNLILLDGLAANPAVSPKPAQVRLLLLGIIWSLGAALFVGTQLVRYAGLKKQALDAVPGESGVYYSDTFSMPMVLGILKPRIYLPSIFLKEENSEEKAFILAHEIAHQKRYDHLTKLLAFGALAVHWFNPLVWAAFFLFGRDVEMACDEYVMERMGEKNKKGYSLALLRFEERRSALLIPLAFGESHTKSRIRNILNYKKPGFWASLAGLVLLVLAASTLLTSPREKAAEAISIIGGADGPTSIFLAGKIGGDGEGASSPAEPMDVETVKKQPYGMAVELDYVSAGKISMHGAFGYLSFNLSENGNSGWKANINSAVTLSEAGKIWMQGDSYTELLGSEDSVLVVTNAYSPSEEKRFYFYSETAGLIEEQTDAEMKEALLSYADHGVFRDAYVEAELSEELSGVIRERFGQENYLLYGPAEVLETNSNVYGFLAADGENLENVWYGLWLRDMDELTKIPLFE